jgi:arylformamidase
MAGGLSAAAAFRKVTPATARAITSPMNIYDISLPLQAGSPCWPGKSPLALTATRSLLRGDHCTSHTIGMDIHLGTHIDAPAHFIADGITLDQVPLATMVGPCRVIEFLGSPASEIPSQIMAGGHPSERVLFKTFNSQLLSHSKFDPRFVALSEDLAHLLVQDGVRLVGIDYFSVDRFNSPGRAVHHILLGSGVLILEGINLAAVEPGDYQLIALPLNLVGAEGSPVRAVLVR